MLDDDTSQPSWVAVEGGREHDARATWGQQFMWEVADRLRGGGELLALTVDVPVPPGVTVETIEAALVTLYRRHDALRTHLSGTELSNLRQSVRPRVDVPVHTCDALSDDDADRAAEILTKKLQRLGFMPGDECLTRVTVSRSRGCPRRVGFVLSHMVVDGWSARQVGEEFARILSGDVESETKAAQPVEQATFESSTDGLRVSRLAIEHQRSVFEQLPASTPGGGRFDADSPRFRQGLLRSPRTLLAARSIARQCRVMESTVLLAASIRLLARLTMSSQVPMLLWTHNRGRHGSRSIVGQYAQVVPVMFAAHEGDPADLVREVQLTALRAFRHGLYSPLDAAQLRSELEARAGAQLPLGFRFNYMGAPDPGIGGPEDRRPKHESRFSWGVSADEEDVVASFDVFASSATLAVNVDSRFLPLSDVETTLRRLEADVCLMAESLSSWATREACTPGHPGVRPR